MQCFLCKIKRYGSRKVANKTQFWTVYLLRSSFFKFPKIAAYQRKLRMNEDSAKSVSSRTNVSQNFPGNFPESFPRDISTEILHHLCLCGRDNAISVLKHSRFKKVVK